MTKKKAAKKKMTRKAAKKKAAKKKAAKKKSKKGGTFFGHATRPKPKKKSAVRKKKPTKRAESGTKRSAVSPKRSTNGDTFESGLVFVAMSFQQPGMDDVFSAIKDSCKSLKLRARRVDENVTSGFIILEIVDLIERAEFIIFDLTYERPNVYYELGYSHGVGNAPSNILLIAKDGTDVHFDIAALRVRFYTTTESLRKLIKECLRAMMNATRK